MQVLKTFGVSFRSFVSFTSFGSFEFLDRRMIQKLKSDTSNLRILCCLLGLFCLSCILGLLTDTRMIQKLRVVHGQILGFWILYWVFCVFHVFLSFDFIDIKHSKLKRRPDILKTKKNLRNNKQLYFG